jgi:hypothetical protein
MNHGEVQARLRKAAKIAHHARVHGYSAEDIACSETARRTTLAYAGYLERGASMETWEMVFTMMTEDES